MGELGLHEVRESVSVERIEPRRLGQPDGGFVHLGRIGCVGRPRTAVHPGLRRPVNLDVNIARAGRHHQFAVDHHVEARRGFALGDQRARGKRLDTTLCAEQLELCVVKLFEQEKSA